MASSLFGPKAIQPQPAYKQPSATPESNSGQSSSSLEGFRNLMAMAQAGGNPRKMAESILSRTPGYQNVMNLVNQYGGDARAAFYAEAERKGVDPNTILSMLR